MYLKCNKQNIIIDDCTTFFSRLIGFMFKIKTIKIGKRFPKCNSIHTFFMFQKIDVIMTDKDNKIIKMYPNLKTWKVILPQKNVYYTYELPIWVCEYYKIGDTLKIKELENYKM